MSKAKSPQELKTAFKGCLLAIFIVVVIGSIVWKFLLSSEAPNTENERTFTKADALVNSRSFVERELIAPASADFSESQDGVTQINDTVFDVKSYVDAQNGFGAMIRQTYYCTVIFSKKTGYVRVEDLKIEQTVQ